MVEGTTRPKEVEELEAKRRAKALQQQQQQAAVPLPYPYWTLGTEVAGAQPYVSGKPPTPAYKAPEGQVITGTQIVHTPPMSVQQALHPTGPQMEVTTQPKTYEAPISLFGIKEYEWNPESRVLTEVVYTKQGERVKVPTKFASFEDIITGRATLTPHQQSALLGMGLTSVTATGTAIPLLGGFAVGGATIAEVGKFTLTGEHLTVPEAISYAGIGELAGASLIVGARSLQPRVSRSLTVSYRGAVEKGELWSPSFTQKMQMKITGAPTPRLAQEIVGAGEPQGVSFAMLQKGETVRIEEAYFWEFPTPRSAQVYLRSPEPKVKAWAISTLVKRVQLEGLFTTTLRTGYITETEKPLKATLPYIPKEPYLTTAKAVTPFPTLTVATFGLTKTKQKQTLKQSFRSSLVQESTQLVSTRQILGSAQAQRQVLGLTQTQITSQATKQMLGTPAPTPTLTLPKTAFPYYPRAGGFGEGKGARGLFGKWFPRTHKVKTWQQQLKTFGLTGTRKRRRKKR